MFQPIDARKTYVTPMKPRCKQRGENYNDAARFMNKVFTDNAFVRFERQIFPHAKRIADNVQCNAAYQRIPKKKLLRLYFYFVPYHSFLKPLKAVPITERNAVKIPFAAALLQAR